MPAEGFTVLLQDPIVWLLGAVLALGLYRLSGARKRRLHRQRAALRQRARQAASPRERRLLMAQWRDLGGPQARVQGERLRDAREQGQRARAEGQPRSANPFRQSQWGQGRLWKEGWESVERRIRWIEERRE